MNKLLDYKTFFFVNQMRRRIKELEEERDKWRDLYEQTLAIAVQATDHE
tara:strand:+ start:1500 stop:1646 length:147 start_codon:yes stop_codon:yes gene_type:complete